VQQDGVLHQVLDAHDLHLVQEVPGGLVPRPEVDLRHVVGHSPAGESLEVGTLYCSLSEALQGIGFKAKLLLQH